MRRRAAPDVQPPRRSVGGLLATVVVVVALAMPIGLLGPLLTNLLPRGSGPVPSSIPSAFVLGSPAVPVTEPSAVPVRTTTPGATIRVVPATLDASGGIDVTRAIQAFIDDAPDGATIRFQPGARYRMEGTIRLRARTGLTIDGQGATFVATQQTADPDRAHWSIEGSTGIQLRDLTIQGAHPEPGTYIRDFEWQHAVQVIGGSAIELGPGLTTSGNQGDGVYVAGQADGVHVHDCRISWTGRMGVAVVAGRNVIVERCRLDNIAFSAFDIEPNEGNVPPQSAERITFRDNVIDGPVFSKFFALGGFGSISDVLVARNHVTGARNGIAVDARPLAGTPRRSDVTIIDNVGDGLFEGFDAVMHFAVIDRLTVVGNRQAVQPGGIHFALGQDWTDVRIEGNDCPGCAD